MRRFWVFCLLLCLSLPAWAERVQVAVAANFADVLQQLKPRFEAQSGHTLVPIIGSTGKHYAQIRHGAPYDVFLAADKERPQRLEKEGAIVPDSRFTYAVGRLVLWGSKADNEEQLRRTLAEEGYRYLAIANPKLAPYGRAAKDTLQALKLWPLGRKRVVLGENIGQTFQFVRTANADLGFVAYSQVKKHMPDAPYWLVPENLHQAIEQQAVLLRDKPGARAFWQFLQSAESRALIETFGYGHVGQADAD